MSKKVINAKKINGYVCLRYKEDKYGIHFISEEDNKYEGKRFDLFIWNPNYESPMGGKHNKYNIPEEIVMRAFMLLYPDMNKYYDVYNRLYNKKEVVKVNNSAIDILTKALREQGDMYEKALQQQSEMNRNNIENIIALVTTNNTIAVADNTSEKVVENATVNISCITPEDDEEMIRMTSCDEDYNDEEPIVVEEIEKEDLSFFDSMILDK